MFGSSHLVFQICVLPSFSLLPLYFLPSFLSLNCLSTHFLSSLFVLFLPSSLRPYISSLPSLVSIFLLLFPSFPPLPPILYLFLPFSYLFLFFLHLFPPLFLRLPLPPCALSSFPPLLPCLPLSPFLQFPLSPSLSLLCGFMYCCGVFNIRVATMLF